jgi:hypothetical protein
MGLRPTKVDEKRCAGAARLSRPGSPAGPVLAGWGGRTTGCGATGSPWSACSSSGLHAGPAGLEKICKIRLWRKRHRCPEKCALVDVLQTTGETSAYIFLHPRDCRKLGESNFSHLLETRATNGSRRCFSESDAKELFFLRLRCYRGYTRKQVLRFAQDDPRRMAVASKRLDDEQKESDEDFT